LTTTSPISAVFLVEQLAELGERGVDPPGYRGGRGRDLLAPAITGRASGSRFEPRHGMFEARDRVGEFAQWRRLYCTFSYFCNERIWAGRGVSKNCGHCVHDTSPT
jgi:hypothetical protein